MGFRRFRYSGLILLMLLSASQAFSQSVHDGTLTGIVTAGNERLPGVTVRITSPSLVTGERTVITDTDGRFVFLSIPPGTYGVNATLEGFKTYATRGVVIHAGDKIDLKVAMVQGAYQESITVTGAAPVVDTHSSTIDTTFTDAMLQKLPTARNAFYDLATTAPGIANVGAEESWLPSPSAFGSSASDNIFLVNGVNATNPRGAPWGSLVSVNYNTVEEVKVLSLGSKAEYGSFSGVAIDVLTKSGGNDYKGDVAYYTQVGNAADNSTLKFGNHLYWADPNDVLTSRPQSSWEGSATFGGPVLRDKLWFYAGFAKYKAETDTPLFAPLSLWDSKLFDLKLTGDFTAKHRAWLAYHREDQTAGNNTWGQTWDGTMVYDSPQKNDTFQAQYQWVVSDRDLVSAKYLGFNTRQSPTIPATVGHPGYINWWKWIGTQSIGVNGDFPNVEAQKSKRNTIQADMTHYAADFLGQHEMKFGVQYTKSHGDWEGGYFQGYANFAYPYPYNYGPAKNWWWNCDADWCWGTDNNPVFPMYNNKTFMNPWLTVRKADSTGAFLDDSWNVSDRITLNLGVRYDRMTAKYGKGLVYEMPQTPADINNPTVLRSREGTGNVFDFKTWSPRLGLAWVLTDDQRTVLRAHYGRYYSPIGVESLRRFGPDMEPTRVETWRYDLPMSLVDLNGNGMIDFNEVRPATRLLAGRTPTTLMSSDMRNDSWALEVAPGTTSPYTDQFHISLQRQIGREFAVEGAFIHKKTNDLIALKRYDTGSGQYYNWVYSTKDVGGSSMSAWEVELKDYNGDGKTDVNDAKYVLSHSAYRAVNMTSFNGKDVGRTYDGLQLVLTKRYSQRWQGLASVNWNTSDGLAPRSVSQDWYIDGGMIMDTPFGATPNDFQNNLEGPLPMTPKWMIKASGSYRIPRIETDFGLRYRFDSGRPLFPVESVPAYGSWMSDIPDSVFLGGGNIVAGDPKHPDWFPSTSIFDFNLTKELRFASYGFNLSFDVLNALNENSPNKIGFKAADYGRVYGIVQPRTYRAGVKFLF